MLLSILLEIITGACDSETSTFEDALALGRLWRPEALNFLWFVSFVQAKEMNAQAASEIREISGKSNLASTTIKEYVMM